MKLTQATGPTLGGRKPKGRKNSTMKPGEKQTSKTISFKKLITAIIKVEKCHTK